MTDRRRRRWFALSATWAVGGTGERIRSRFGLAGLAVWAAYLAACKTAVNEGEIEYVTEDQAWRILLREAPEPIPFGLDEFFAYTGSALHHTRRVRRGGVTVVECLRWREWNRLADLDLDLERTGRKRVESGSKAGRKRVDKTPAKRHKKRGLTETETGTGSGKNPQTSTSTRDPDAPPPVWSEGIQSLVDAESSRNGKAAVDEKAFELDRLEALLADRDENTRVVLERAAADLPVGVLRELHHEIEARGSEVRRPSAYAVGALQREARRRAGRGAR